MNNWMDDLRDSSLIMCEHKCLRCEHQFDHDVDGRREWENCQDDLTKLCMSCNYDTEGCHPLCAFMLNPKNESHTVDCPNGRIH